MLIQLLTFDSPDVQASAALALAVISEHLSARDAVKEWGQFLFIHSICF